MTFIPGFRKSVFIPLSPDDRYEGSGIMLTADPPNEVAFIPTDLLNEIGEVSIVGWPNSLETPCFNASVAVKRAGTHTCFCQAETKWWSKNDFHTWLDKISVHSSIAKWWIKVRREHTHGGSTRWSRIYSNWFAKSYRCWWLSRRFCGMICVCNCKWERKYTHAHVRLTRNDTVGRVRRWSKNDFYTRACSFDSVCFWKLIWHTFDCIFG